MKPPRALGAVLEILKWYRKVCGTVFPKQRTLARKLGLALRTVQRALAWLRAHGYLKVQRRGPTSAVYTLEEQAIKRPADQQLAFDFGGSFGVSFGIPSITELKPEFCLSQQHHLRKPAVRASRNEDAACKTPAIALERSGVEPFVARAAVAIGRARHLAMCVNRNIVSKIRSWRYFLGCVEEVRSNRPQFTEAYVEHAERWVERWQTAGPVEKRRLG